MHLSHSALCIYLPWRAATPASASFILESGSSPINMCKIYFMRLLSSLLDILLKVQVAALGTSEFPSWSNGAEHIWQKNLSTNFLLFLLYSTFRVHKDYPIDSEERETLTFVIIFFHFEATCGELLREECLTQRERRKKGKNDWNPFLVWPVTNSSTRGRLADTYLDYLGWVSSLDFSSISVSISVLFLAVSISLSHSSSQTILVPLKPLR